ncbi:hypothetical protein [Embleya sp. NPDC020886]|uniref:hypothetical protein n=1 Tax=Embleya sp. NPDC020886 TaxID=3363980 RepID=UPI0037B7EA9F
METSPLPSAPTTPRAGSVRLLNDWGIELSSVTVRHRRGNDPRRQDEKTWNSVAPGSTAEGALAITYDARGVTHPDSYDYWWVKLIARDEEVQACKDDFFCSLTPDDDGTVTLTLDGGPRKLHVEFSHSTGCSVALHPIRT